MSFKTNTITAYNFKWSYPASPYTRPYHADEYKWAIWHRASRNPITGVFGEKRVVGIQFQDKTCGIVGYKIIM